MVGSHCIQISEDVVCEFRCALGYGEVVLRFDWLAIGRYGFYGARVEADWVPGVGSGSLEAWRGVRCCPEVFRSRLPWVALLTNA